uniref:Reverse transcriptase domain-containing protein n=1 Tax=Leptobrachium leishanense TaxID=445787 RepID=A0A8C5R857_9ANUR
MLSRPQANELATPITTEEILPILKELRTSKAPGPDGFSPLYYKKFRTQLAPLLTNMYNGFLEGKSPPKELLAASIVVIPKEGKDPSTCASYRPISLLNVDMKIYAKVLATRLSRHLPSLVHPDQVGFIPSRGAPDNIRRTVNLLSIAHASKQPSLLLSLDAEKAFDRVDWTYLWEVLRRFGVGEGMIGGIRALYTSPTASVITMGGRSRPFDILNGTRQGCPLSPLLFALCLEPLAEQIRGHPDISGIAVGDKHYKLSLFADDILLTITRPLVSLPNLYGCLSSFGALSGYKINIAKSEALNISLPQEVVTHLRESFTFRWCPHRLQYLGIYLTAHVPQLYAGNYPDMIKHIKSLLRQWSSYSISWMGRIYALKMTALPKLLYLFRTLPVPLPLTILPDLQSAFYRYVWQGKKPRVSRLILRRPKKHGGLAVPDLALYYKSAQLTQLLQWSSRRGRVCWVDIENDYVAPSCLSQVPWRQISAVERGRLLPTTAHSLDIWSKVKYCMSLTTTTSGLLPLRDNPLFPPWNGEEGRAFEWWLRKGFTTLGAVLLQGKFPRWEYFRESHDIPLREFHRYSQIRHFVRSRLNIGTPVETPFERLVMRSSSTAGAISQIYSLLLHPSLDRPCSYQLLWEADLCHQFTGEEWGAITESSMGITTCTLIKENCYKLLSRWYLDPVRLQKIYPALTGLCTRGCGQRGTFYHMWWECGLVIVLWSSVFAMISRALGLPVPPDPALALLNSPSRRHGLPRSSLRLAHRICTSTRICIARSWKRDLPSIPEIEAKVWYIYKMERLTAQLHDTLQQCTKIWEPWLSTQTIP